MSLPLGRAAGQGLVRRLLLAFGLCVAASLIHAAFSQLVFSVIAPRWDAASVSGWLGGAMTNFWVFAAWSALYFALDYDTAARDSRLALAGAHADLLEAQNLALVRQVDPHFLFNALNTVSGLIGEGDTERADRTTLALARLLRGTFQREMPPFRTLGEELAAQGAYLDVQAARFPDRFTFVDAVPEALRARRVPTLILQPLIENAFTHGVARSEDRVTLEVTAREDAERLILIVRDDASPAGKSAHDGAGIGLDNVRRRLETLYGARAALAFALREPRGWMTEVTLP
jgi:LytS/YehU family sensor histidine kinase